MKILKVGMQCIFKGIYGIKILKKEKSVRQDRYIQIKARAEINVILMGKKSQDVFKHIFKQNFV